jgi:exonuclease III
LTFGLLNVQSANNKIDDILDMKNEHGLDIMLLTETWHDTDSVSIRRLRAEGMQLIERSRPRSSLSGVNHGGVAIAATPGVRLSSSVDINKRSVRTFEYLCVRVVSRDASCTVLLIYRPGSNAVSDAFFIELSSLLDDLATLAEPVFITGDFNIRLDRPDDVSARKLFDIFEMYDLTCRVNKPSHDRNGLLDVVATRNDTAVPEVDVTAFFVG